MFSLLLSYASILCWSQFQSEVFNWIGNTGVNSNKLDSLIRFW